MGDAATPLPGSGALLDVAAAYFEPHYFGDQGARAERSARAVAPMLLELAPARSAVDLGCGTGAWLQVLAEHGVEEVLGVDGPYIDRNVLRIPEESFVGGDLSAPPHLERTFDLALSLEAAHYVPEAAAEAVVGFLTAAAPVVYFSAAVPHQPGGPGVNRQWPGYWSGLFARQGFRCYDVLRERLWEHPGVDWWYAQNGLLFVRDGAAAPHGVAPAEPLPLVHPELLALVAEPEPEPETKRRRLLGRRSA